MCTFSLAWSHRTLGSLWVFCKHEKEPTAGWRHVGLGHEPRGCRKKETDAFHKPGGNPTGRSRPTHRHAMSSPGMSSSTLLVGFSGAESLRRAPFSAIFYGESGLDPDLQSMAIWPYGSPINCGFWTKKPEIKVVGNGRLF